MALLVSCGGNQTKNAQASVPEDLRENRVELLVFYGAQRCATCHAIEDRSKEVRDLLNVTPPAACCEIAIVGE